MSSRVLVIGAGVIGQTAALRLLEAGFEVRIFAADLPPDTTSDIAAAVWYPYLAEPRDRVVGWAMQSLRYYGELTGDSQSGVSWIELREFFRGDPPQPEWRAELPGWRVLETDECPRSYKSGSSFQVPLIEMPLFLPWLRAQIIALGGSFSRVSRLSSLSEVDSQHTVIVNCSGLGSRELCRDDQMYPIRGQVERLEKLPFDHVLVDDDGPTYIIPRSNDAILGGTAEENDWDLTPRRKTRAAILERCSELTPMVAGIGLISSRVGLRPGRKSVRLEMERTEGGRVVIHNYGHGGSGVTLSWGCAEEVVTLIIEGSKRDVRSSTTRG